MKFTGAEAEAVELEARFKFAASPAALEFQRSLAAHSKRLTNALRRSGFTGEPSWQILMAAWRSVGLPIQDFGRSNTHDLIGVLEAKLKVLDRIKDRGNPTSRLLLKKAHIGGGRPLGERIDVDELLALRGTASRKAFARILQMHVNTLAEIETTGRASDDSKRKIEAYKRKKVTHKTQITS